MFLTIGHTDAAILGTVMFSKLGEILAHIATILMAVVGYVMTRCNMTVSTSCCLEVCDVIICVSVCDVSNSHR